MPKIRLDKYYTPSDLAEYCVKKTKEVIGDENITEWLEPSAGAGVFLPFLQDKPLLAYDIEPEHNDVIPQDYLDLTLGYKKGRCVIGNPPYGYTNLLSVKFFKKSIIQGDYVSFILPISQHNNNNKMFEFDMVYSEDLGKKSYSDVDVHCCLNIYKRPDNGLNSKPKYNLRDVTLNLIDRKKNKKNKIEKHYDFAFCGWGTNVSKIAEYDFQYASQIHVKINNENLRGQIENFFFKTDWTKDFIYTATPRIPLWRVYKKLSEEIKTIK